jgi:hypothetical protein
MSQSDEVSSSTMFGVPNTDLLHRPWWRDVGRSKHREDVRMRSGVSSLFGMPNRAEIHPLSASKA